MIPKVTLTGDFFFGPISGHVLAHQSFPIPLSHLLVLSRTTPFLPRRQITFLPPRQIPGASHPCDLTSHARARPNKAPRALEST